MDITLRINNKDYSFEARPEENLLSVLRRLEFLGAKSGGSVWILYSRHDPCC